MHIELFAKSKKPNEGKTGPVTVEQHCHDVADAAETLWTAISSDLACGFKCSTESLEQKLHAILVAAAWLHDFAKINSAFQAILRAKPFEKLRQPVRHEILAAVLLADDHFLGRQLREALPSAADHWALVWAIAGHHAKMGDPARGATVFSIGGTPREVFLPFSHQQARSIFAEAWAKLGSTSSPALGDLRFDTLDDGDDGLEQKVALYVENAARTWAELRGNSDFLRNVALLKAMLIAADVAASALTAKEESTAKWVRLSLATRITRDLLEPVVREGTDGQELHPFQRQIGAAPTDATIVIAGTGNGKTTGAFLWAQKWAIGRKLFFTYPTTGTASAGYEDYLFEHRQIASELIHGRALVDLQAMRGTPDDDNADEGLRIESLKAWDRQAVVCTVDTVLGIMQNQRRSLYSFPAIAAGAFVFDEIHSYDPRLFGALLRFLKTFPGLPVLLMSASISPVRLQQLQRALGERLGPIVRGDPLLEGFKRYRLEKRESAQACRSTVTDALGRRKKVLWVCNTVGDAIKEARQASTWSGLKADQIVVFHSRFRYCDRVDRQKAVIRKFGYDRTTPKPWPRMEPSPLLAITTQVCEMSLDISADLMVTAECPLPALVQRLGRLNRYACGDDPWTCLVYPFQGDPYNEKLELINTRGDFRAVMGAARAAVNELGGEPCSQRDLAVRLDNVNDAEKYKEYSAWLDDGWLTEPAPLRDGDSITLIREEDLDEIADKLGPEHNKPSKWTSRSLVSWTIPMLHTRDFEPVRRAGGYPVVANGTVTYTREEGATWRTNTK
jgi:CRISPR-associated endonuclease/helicase Cas3